MGGDACRHTDRDPFRAVYEQVRHTHGQDKGLFLRLVKVRSEVYDVFVQIRKTHFLGKFCQPCLGVTHGRRPVSFDGAEVAVAVHKGLSLLEILRHDHQRLIDGAVPVGMVFTHGISHDTGAFAVWFVIADAQLVHVIESAPLDRLEPVPYIRQGAGDDHAHGVIDI